MNCHARLSKFVMVFAFCAILAGCVAGPGGTYYAPGEAPPPPPPADTQLFFDLGQNDRNFILRVDDRTPFNLYQLPAARQVLYSKGYDEVRREKRADFVIDVVVSTGVRDNPNQRAVNTVGGALAGAAAGAIIGGALGDPGYGAAVGAASGGALGLVSPAGTTVVRIDVNVNSYTGGRSSFGSRTLDLAGVPPYDVQRFIDNEVARMFETIPPK